MRRPYTQLLHPTVVPQGEVAVKQLDLADVQSIKAFADSVNAELKKLDVLILNAGVMAPPKRLETKDGLELQIGTNHVGHQYLTQLLLPKLKQARGRGPQGGGISVAAGECLLECFPRGSWPGCCRGLGDGVAQQSLLV